MRLEAGSSVGPYLILAPLGAGGMGEVWRARDTRLGREVAVKFLHPGALEDAQRLARFEQEARATSRLAHPNILVVHDVGSHEGQPYLVSELLDGESLRAKLAGPLPVRRAVDYALQVARGLAAAHEKGIVHRDIKPENLFVTKDGRVKILDFGLAKLGAGAVSPDAATAIETHSMSEAGMLIGTVRYMAPEQIRGQKVDERTDLFALGVVLYEMLTGRRPFEQPSQQETMAAILKEDPAELGGAGAAQEIPPALERIVRHCLEKDPAQRAQSARDLAFALETLSQLSASVVALAPAAAPRGRWRRAAILGAAGLALALATAGLLWQLRAPPPRPTVAHLTLDVRPAEELNSGGGVSPFAWTPGGSRTAFAWTPDGQALVFVGRRGDVQQLYVRRLDADAAEPLPGTDDARTPAISSDGQWVAFSANGAIKKVPLGGGPVQEVAADVGSVPFGLAWDAHGRIYYGQVGGRIWRIPLDGAAEAVTALGEAEIRHVLPWPLPGGGVLLYTVRKREWSWGDEEIVAQTLASGERKILLRDAADARYVPTGHLLFLRRGVLFAVPFDAERLEVRGSPIAVLDTVAHSLTGRNSIDATGAGQFAIAATGTLAWLPAPLAAYPEADLVRVDRTGKVSPTSAPARSYTSALRVSPDGRRLAAVISSLSEVGLWIYDLERGTLSPLARSGEVYGPVWTRDGQALTFHWLDKGQRHVAMQPADGSAPPRVVMPGELYPASFTPDGRQLLVVDAARDDILRVTVDTTPASAQPLIATPDSEVAPELSPDGKWLAYASYVSGREEVYLRPFPGPGPTEQVSLASGRSMAWHPSGRELLFVTLSSAGDNWWTMMAADITPGSPPRIGRPSPVFAIENNLSFQCVQARCYDIAPDGQGFYAVRQRDLRPPPAPKQVQVILNWFEELKAKVPSGR